MGELVKRGVAPGRMTAEGYEEEHPVADNATEEGRATNRRISLRVTEK
jgi:outer membrane protein OmpA-like peptidoglycan-associated protein